MTENRWPPTPPPRTAPFVTPTGNGNNAPPADNAKPVPKPNPDTMTKEMLTTAVTEIALLLAQPQLLEENPGAAIENFRTLTRAAVGDATYHRLYKVAVTDILVKGGDAGTEMIENVHRRVGDNFPARNTMITQVKNARIFGADENKFRENYKIIGGILEDAIEKYGQTLHADHTGTKEKFTDDLMNILTGEKPMVIRHLTADERKKHIPAAEPA